MKEKKLRNNVERWLIQDNYSFKEIVSQDENFIMHIKHVGSFANSMEIFEPKKQQNVLVIGVQVTLKNNQNARYLKLNDEQKINFEKKVAEFSNSIQAIHKFSYVDGKKKIGIYAVLDKEEQLNQPYFQQTIQKVADMSDKMNHFLMKTF